MKFQETDDYKKWVGKQRDPRLLLKIVQRLARIELGLFGDVKPVGEGVSEIRIDYAQGYRIYFKQRGDELIILLCAGDKSSQQADIEKAKALSRQL